MTIEELGLSVSSYNILKRAGINFIEEISSKSEAQLLSLKNCKRKNVEEIKKTITAHGYHFSDN